jgi:hypothetical protein
VFAVTSDVEAMQLDNMTGQERLDYQLEEELFKHSAFETAHMTLVHEGHMERLAMEEEFYQQKLAIQDRAALDEQELWGGHHTKVLQFGQAARKGDKADMLKSGIAMLDIGAQQSKRVFKLQKTLGIAQAIISTQKGIAEAWGYGPILGPAMAALVALNGFAAVNAIRSTEFGGGSSSSSSTGSLGAITTPAAPVDPETEQSTGINIYIEGNLYANDDFRRALVDALGQAQANDEIRITNAN